MIPAKSHRAAVRVLMVSLCAVSVATCDKPTDAGSSGESSKADSAGWVNYYRRDLGGIVTASYGGPPATQLASLTCYVGKRKFEARMGFTDPVNIKGVSIRISADEHNFEFPLVNEEKNKNGRFSDVANIDLGDPIFPALKPAKQIGFSLTGAWTSDTLFTGAANDALLKVISACSANSQVGPEATDYGPLGKPDPGEYKDFDPTILTRSPEATLALFRTNEQNPPQGTEDHPMEFDQIVEHAEYQRALFYRAQEALPQLITAQDRKWLMADEKFLITSYCDNPDRGRVSKKDCKAVTEADNFTALKHELQGWTPANK